MYQPGQGQNNIDNDHDKIVPIQMEKTVDILSDLLLDNWGI